MKCPECVKEGERSCVYPGMSTTTCMGGQRYYDEDGRLHVHDPNVTTSEFSCSRGHKWTTKQQHGTCWCETVKDAEFTEVPADTPVPFANDANETITVEVVPPLPHSILDSMERLLGYPEPKLERNR